MEALLIVVVALAIVLAVAGGYWYARRSDRGPIEPPPAAGTTAVATPPSPRADVEAALDAVVDATAEPVVEEPLVEVRPRLRDRLGKTRAAFSGYVRGVRGRAVGDDVYDELEEALLLADVGVATTQGLLERVRARAADARAADADAIVELLRDEVSALLTAGGDRALTVVAGEPNVWMFVGVNGVGKTTTIGKLAAQQRELGHRAVLAAGDTFRAAAAEQLALWAQRTGSELVRGQEGADPGSVVFDAMSAASSRDADLVLVDTAGRLHTKANLMEELRKLRRIVDRTEGALKEVLLVIDATTGQNGLVQARQFAEAVDVTGIVLTKLDGTAKGGIVLAIQAELGLPVKVVGVGEGVGDLVAFEPSEFAAALFDE
ncbi:MAG TPA: signal recognition particle-docking protein FtsY [Acidimicrobiia bacterium]|nr:signal recognition particle-docking protein FtsY [Acidimicrobiia bacterium]